MTEEYTELIDELEQFQEKISKMKKEEEKEDAEKITEVVIVEKPKFRKLKQLIFILIFIIFWGYLLTAFSFQMEKLKTIETKLNNLIIYATHENHKYKEQLTDMP